MCNIFDVSGALSIIFSHQNLHQTMACPPIKLFRESCDFDVKFFRRKINNQALLNREHIA